jgi:glycosylphosphatidylinositol transamidase (GPIT) subunit GPI8
VADINDRKAILAAVKPHGKKALARFNEERRSSMNDIAGYAHQLAQKLRKRHGND